MSARPPRVARALLWRVLPREAREFIVGDLDEEFIERARDRRGARLWYWSQAIRSMVHLSRREPSMPRGLRFALLIPTLIGDARIACRGFRRSPGFAAAAILTLALGVGASIAIFSALNQVLLRPLAFADPDRLAMVWESNQERDWHQVHAAPANVEDWRTRVAAFSDVAFFNDRPVAVSRGGGREPGQAIVAQVSGNLFDVLGVPPMLGRTFRRDETFDDGRVVLSHGVWRSQFGGDPTLVGRTIRLDGKTYEVVGVMGPDFRYALSDADAWVTMPHLAARRSSVWYRRAHVVRAIARLAPAAMFDQAAAELLALSVALEREYPATNRMMRAGLTPLKTFLVGDNRRRTLWTLFGAVGILQLIGCLNVASLFHTRSLGRRDEMALRAALGAGRGRLVRQLLTESAVLAAAGTALGLALGFAGFRALTAIRPPELDGLAFQADWRLALFVVALACGSALLFGLWPAWQASRIGSTRALAAGSRTATAGRQRLLAAHGLVVFEVAMAVLLVVSAGLMIRTLDELRKVRLGVEATDVLTFQVAPAAGAYGSNQARAAFAERLEARIAAQPGVTAVGVARGLPLQGYGFTSDFTIDRWPPDRFGIDVRNRQATRGYFEALRIPLLHGRLFDESDLADGRPLPLIVNRAFADQYFPGSTPVGRRLTFARAATPESIWYPIIGVVENERRALTEDPKPEVIAHLRADPPGTFSYVVRTAVPPLSLSGAIRAELLAMDRETPLLRVRTLDDVVLAARASERFVMLLLAAFALAALVLAAVGVYGVTLETARARRREVGIRLALGAPAASIVGRLAARGALCVSVGIVIGLAAALAGTRLLSSMLFNVDPRDPLTLGAVVIVIGGVAFASIMWPTVQAARLDPIRVLRQ
jgi:predicted permease